MPWLLALAAVPFAHMGTLNATAHDPPQAKFVVLSNNGDRKSCPLSPGLEYSVYVTSKPGACIAWAPPEHGAQLSFKMELTATGIRPTFCFDYACGLGGGACTQSTEVAYGGCWQPSHDLDLVLTLDVVDELPTPTPGRVLERICWAQRSCECAEAYRMYTTGCNNDAAQGFQDYQVYCEEGIAGYSAFKYIFYGSTDGTCSGTRDESDVVTAEGCTPLGNKLASTAVWCGAPCSKWKTLRAAQPKCDDPRSGSHWAIDLEKALGPRCRPDTPVGACCYAPLGYDGGEDFGTPCDAVCAHVGRVGHRDEWCGASSGAHYGNCFCGAAITGLRPGSEPPAPPPPPHPPPSHDLP